MPFVLIGTGVLLIITGVKGNPTQLYTLLQGDFTGKNNFLYWMLSILLIGFLGYIEKLQPLSRAFMFLVIVVLFLHNEGFLTKFQQQVFGTSSSSSSSSTGS